MKLTFYIFPLLFFLCLNDVFTKDKQQVLESKIRNCAWEYIKSSALCHDVTANKLYKNGLRLMSEYITLYGEAKYKKMMSRIIASIETREGKLTPAAKKKIYDFLQAGYDEHLKRQNLEEKIENHAWTRVFYEGHKWDTQYIETQPLSSYNIHEINYHIEYIKLYGEIEYNSLVENIIEKLSRGNILARIRSTNYFNTVYKFIKFSDEEKEKLGTLQYVSEDLVIQENLKKTEIKDYEQSQTIKKLNKEEQQENKLIMKTTYYFLNCCYQPIVNSIGLYVDWMVHDIYVGIGGFSNNIGLVEIGYIIYLPSKKHIYPYLVLGAQGIITNHTPQLQGTFAPLVSAGFLTFLNREFFLQFSVTSNFFIERTDGIRLMIGFGRRGFGFE